MERRGESPGYKAAVAKRPVEFGYAVGASRPLALKASAQKCNFCRENFSAGVEMYGDLGDTISPGLHETSHYLAPAAAWNLPSGWTFRVSPGFGLNDNSHRLLIVGAYPGNLLGLVRR